jgi:hypothetical protein
MFAQAAVPLKTALAKVKTLTSPPSSGRPTIGIPNARILAATDFMVLA